MTPEKPANYHVRIPHALFDALISRQFTPSEKSIVDAIIRFQLGFGLMHRSFLRQRDFEFLGLGGSTISEALTSLQQKQVVYNDNDFFQLLPAEQWEVEDRAGYDDAEYQGLITKHIVKQRNFGNSKSAPLAQAVNNGFLSNQSKQSNKSNPCNKKTVTEVEEALTIPPESSLNNNA